MSRSKVLADHLGFRSLAGLSLENTRILLFAKAEPRSVPKTAAVICELDYGFPSGC